MLPLYRTKNKLMGHWVQLQTGCREKKKKLPVSNMAFLTNSVLLHHAKYYNNWDIKSKYRKSLSQGSLEEYIKSWQLAHTVASFIKAFSSQCLQLPSFTNSFRCWMASSHCTVLAFVQRKKWKMPGFVTRRWCMNSELLVKMRWIILTWAE